MKYLRILFISFILGTNFALVRCDAEPPQQVVQEQVERPLVVAIFSRNKTRNADYDKYAEMLRSGLVSQLSGTFTIIDKDDVINSFEKEAKKEGISDIGSFLDSLARPEKQDNRSIEQKSSALRISQGIGANCFLIADLEEVVSNNVQDEVYGNKINDYVITADVAVKILDGVRGGTVLADETRAQKRLRGDEKTIFSEKDIDQSLPRVMKDAAKDVAKIFLKNTKKIQDFKSTVVSGGSSGVAGVTGVVPFRIKSNVGGAIAELDGFTIGSIPGTFNVMPGFHKLKVTKPGYQIFEEDVNIAKNGLINVTMIKGFWKDLMNWTFLIILLIVLWSIVSWGMTIFNEIIKLSQNVKTAFSNIDVLLKRRLDLIPNYIEMVKGYMKHEQGTLEAVTKARQIAVDASTIKDKIAAENVLTSTLRSLMMVVENYPNLKADQPLMKAQNELAFTENKISTQRMDYNNTVRLFNSYIKTFPNLILAKLLKIKEEPFFGLDSPEERKAPIIKMT